MQLKHLRLDFAIFMVWEKLMENHERDIFKNPQHLGQEVSPMRAVGGIDLCV